MKLIFAGFLLFAGFQSYSQNYKILKGTYVINKEKVKWGQAPERVLPSSYNIQPAKGHIAIKRKMIDIQAEVLEDMNLDGTPFKRELPASGKATASLSTVNDTCFTVDKMWMDGEGKMTLKSKETWMIEDAGKMLTIKYDVAQADGNIYTLVGYYEKK